MISFCNRLPIFHFQLKMDELPDLPFDHVLSYLSLEDLIKCRAVSRRWKMKIDNFKVKSLCYSDHSIRRILGKKRFVSGAFAQNFISSTRFASFFNTFGQKILSNLKRFRLCSFRLNPESATAFAPVLNSFALLEELDVVRADFQAYDNVNLLLNLPMLHSVQLREISAISRITLDAPRLVNVMVSNYNQPTLRLDIVHGRSVEKLVIDRDSPNPLQFTQLKYLYSRYRLEIDSTFLLALERLEEIHLSCRENVLELFNQKQRYRRSQLKIYYAGLLLDSPDDLRGFLLDTLESTYFVNFASRASKLANEIFLIDFLEYEQIESVAPEMAINIAKKLPDLDMIVVTSRVQNVQRFLDFLKTFENIVLLAFRAPQPQELFDRLPEHCAVQALFIENSSGLSDLSFLGRLNDLIEIKLESYMN